MDHSKVWGLAAVLVLAMLSFGKTAQVFHGEVSDSQCALNVHSLTRSHQEMLKSKSMGGTARTCSVYCIEHLGGYPVLSAPTAPTWCTVLRVNA
jgi:hypothetical protein